MAKLPKLLKAVAGAAGGAGLDVDEVFSTYLYEGTGSAQTITNGIDLAGEGGIVWLKDRGDTTPHTIHTTDIGALNYLVPHYISGNNAGSAGYGLTAFNSDGFSLGIDYEGENGSGDDYVSWTFRKAPKFFDIVTWTGDGTTGRSISHSLNSPVGMIIAKKTSGSGQWSVLHRSVAISGSPAEGLGRLNLTNAFNGYSSGFNEEFPSSTAFKVSHVAGASSQTLNTSGENYVAYLFAHNDGDGEFGPDADQDVIKCGSYTGNSNSTGPEINLGFEPQWLMIKRTSNTGGWFVIDTMRGWTNGSTNDPFLRADSNQQEYENPYLKPLATGFQPKTTSSAINFSGDTYIYTAIRRGPLAEPTSGTDVFAVDQENSSAPYYTSNFPVDMAIRTDSQGQGKFISSRITGTEDLRTDSTGAQDSSSGTEWDFMDGYRSSAEGNTWYGWMWKRARGYFDTVAYSGNGSTQNVSHNLGAVPEMIWIKSRNATEEWKVYHSAIGNNKELSLSSTAASGNTSAFNYTTPTSSVFSLGAASPVNDGAYNFIAYLFATVAGISKVGSYTSNGAQQNIDCGFSNGARFVLVKRTDNTGHWVFFDSARGITANTDPHLRLNNTSAQDTDGNIDIEPYSSGFTVNYGSNNLNNNTGQTYIFYAIA